MRLYIADVHYIQVDLFGLLLIDVPQGVIANTIYCSHVHVSRIHESLQILEVVFHLLPMLSEMYHDGLFSPKGVVEFN